jgi:hypothetical protein
LIQFKQSFKTTFILLLFMTVGLKILAGNSFPKYNENSVGQIDTIQSDQIKIPKQLANAPISFRINSTINYLKFSHFVKSESKKMFFQAWLKEKEMQKLSSETDSLRTVYANSSILQKEGITSLILQAEQKSIALSDEIPAMYQKAREMEDQYWKEASPDEIAKFQEKINFINDSIGQIAVNQTNKTGNIHHEIPDTITFFRPSPNKTEIKAAVPSEIIYKIQVGAYKGKVPEAANRLIKKLSKIRKVEKYIDDKGVTIYTTGTLRLYQEAETMLNQVKQEGVKNALIAAYQNGKKITIEEARKLNNE